MQLPRVAIQKNVLLIQYNKIVLNVNEYCYNEVVINTNLIMINTLFLLKLNYKTRKVFLLCLELMLCVRKDVYV